MRNFVKVFAMLCVLASIAVAQDRVDVPLAIVSYPDLIIYNAKIVTMDDYSFGPSPGHTFQAIAIRDRKIQALGGNDEILSYAGPKTDKIDAKGYTIIPGIVDPHTHIHNNEVNYWVNQHPEAVQTMGKHFVVQGNTVEELKKGIELTLKEHTGGMSNDEWAFINLPTNDPKNPGSGTGLGVNFLQKGDMTQQDLDAIDSKHPVFLSAHPAYTINTAAKKAIEKLYGFFPPTEQADDRGFGELTEYERALVVDDYFRKHPAQLVDVVYDGLIKNAAVGITTFCSHMMGLQFLNAYQTLFNEDRQPVRYAYTNYFGFQDNPDPSSFYLRLGDQAGLGNDYFWSAGTGLGYIDSGPPMFCSTMEAPKEVKEREWCRNAPGTALSKAVFVAIMAHERIAVGHSYADKGVDYVMDQVDQAMKLDPTITLDYIRSRRFSSDHCGFYPRPAQIPRLANFGWYISCGGNALGRSYPWLKQYGLSQYANWISPVGSLLKAHVKTVYENEAGVNGNKSGPYWDQGYMLITRKNEYGATVAPEEAIDRMQLMKMSTSWPSEYVLREKQIGSLEAGKLADLVVLNEDYFTVPESEIPKIFPMMTIVGGKIEVLRSEYASEIGRKAIGPQLEFVQRRLYTGGGDQ